MSYDNDYKLVVEFSTPGTYTIHGWYQNTLMLCGGNVFKTITVDTPLSISGNTVLCAGAAATYSLDGTSASWTLSNESTGIVVATVTGASVPIRLLLPVRTCSRLPALSALSRLLFMCCRYRLV